MPITPYLRQRRASPRFKKGQKPAFFGRRGGDPLDSQNLQFWFALYNISVTIEP